MIKEFRTFILRGNVIDLAVGIIIGLAFGQIIDSFVKDLLMPPIGLLLGGADFSNFFINLSDRPLTTLAQAKAAGAPTINYGIFLNTIINFLIIAFVLFLIVRQVNRMRTEPTPTTRPCPYCVSTIPINATRCPHCTSQLTAS